MMIFIAVCLAVITIELALIMIYAILTMRQVRQAASAVEVLAYRLDSQVAAIGSTVRAGWWGAASAGWNFVRGVWFGR